MSLLPGGANADILSGAMELDYSTFDSTTKDAAGNIMQTKTSDFNQRYNLNMRLSPFPTLKVAGGAVLGKDVSDTTTAGLRTKSADDTAQPYFDATFQDPLRIYVAGAGYSKLQEKVSSSNSPMTATVNETSHAMLGMNPVGLPAVGLQVTRSNTYDTARVSQDTAADTVLVSSRYAPRQGVDLSYQAGYTDSRDHLSELDVKSYLQNGRANYTDLFWDKRLSFTAGYNLSSRRTETSQQGGGFVEFQLFPGGLSQVTDTPLTDTLGANGALVDGNLTASAGINIGSSLSIGGDTRAREMGLDFSTVTEVNNLLIWVDRQLTPAIANSFSWDLYASSDNLNWRLLQTVSPAVFGPFVNRFSINFANVQTRYLKVVTRPLSATVQGATDPNFQNIFVTELQAFISRPAGVVRGETVDTAQTYGLSTRTLLLKTADLYHDLSFNMVTLSRTGTVSSSRYDISNGLSLLHRFNPVFSGSGRVAWEDSHDDSGTRRDGLSYNAVLTATPLKTLRSTLVFGGQSTSGNGKSNDSTAATLNTVAELYKGITVNVSGGVSSSTSESGVLSRSSSIQSGVGLVPNPELTVSVNFGTSRSESSGGSLLVGSSSTNTRSEVDATYRPYEAVYLTTSIVWQGQTGKAAYTLQNYGLNWSPFSGGALQFHFTYNENIRSDTGTLEKIIGPGLTWAVFPRATLDLAYVTITSKSDSPAQTSDIKSLGAAFKMLF